MELRDPKKLRRVMVIQDVTQRDVAQAAGYKSHAHIGALLRGEKKTLSVEAAVRIARFLGHDLEDLFVVRVSTIPGATDQPSRAGAA